MKIFSRKVFVFLIFAQNIDCGYMLEPPRRVRHNLCFGAKIGKPLHTSVLLYKSGVQEIYITRTCFRNVDVRRLGIQHKISIDPYKRSH